MLRTLKNFAWSTLSTKQRFTRIYKRNGWRGTESVSGPGSTLAATAAMREWLCGVIERCGFRTLLDAPCGDLNWMADVLRDIEVDYIGVDIVEPLIARNREKHPALDFRCANIISDTLPKADVVLCNDCLIHLSNADIWRLIANLRSTGATHLVTNTYTQVLENHDIATGRWRRVNLSRPPFEFPAPEDEVATGQEQGKMLGLYRIAEIV